MLRVALRPKFLGILALMLLATAVCALLANWQWNRATESARIARDVEQSVAVPLEDVLAAGDPITNDLQGRLVSLDGQFVAEEQFASPGRVIDGTNAAIVVTNFRISTGPLSGTSVPVARGFISESGAYAGHIPAPPSETVHLVARLEASEGATSAPEHTPGGVVMIDRISAPQLVNLWGAPMLGGYLAITEPSLEAMDAERGVGPGADAGEPWWREAAYDLGPLPAVQTGMSQALNPQNIGYMLQWILFGVFFLYIWYRTVRTQYLDEQAELLHNTGARTSMEGI